MFQMLITKDGANDEIAREEDANVEDLFQRKC